MTSDVGEPPGTTGPQTPAGRGGWRGTSAPGSPSEGDDPGGSGPRRKPVTIADIAGYAGVSVPTVSKVLNGHAKVAPGTRERVEAAIRDHGYRRRRRCTDRSDLVEVIFHRLGSDWALEIIRGIQKVARRNHLSVVLSETPDPAQPPGPGWIESVLSRRPVGVIAVCAVFTDADRRSLQTNSIPLVVVDAAGEQVHEIPSVGATNWNGGFAATRHLLDLGHRRIAAISGPADILCARARLDGYRAAMDAAGVSTTGLVLSGEFNVDASRVLAREFLGWDDPPTAIVAGNDLQALGVYDVAREHGLRIPEDLSVIGFDDLPVASWVGPQLTTIRQPLTEMGVDATDLLLRVARGEQLRESRVELATTLVVRGSTARPRGL